LNILSLPTAFLVLDHAEAAMRHRLTIFACCAFIGVAFIGCNRYRGPLASLDASSQLTLYSIDGRDGRFVGPGEEPKTKEKFHGYPALGKIEIADADAREKIVSALKEAVAKSDGAVATCFFPRHGLRAIENGRTIDYVVCFQCTQMLIFDGDSRTEKPITRDPQPLFNNYLKQVGVPLAPSPFPDEK
jgi:hypothetical protein